MNDRQRKAMFAKQYYTVNGYSNNQRVFQTIALPKDHAQELKKDIVSRKNIGSGKWAKNMRFRLVKV